MGCRGKKDFFIFLFFLITIYRCKFLINHIFVMDLRKLQNCVPLRLNLLYFHVLAIRLNSRLRLILNKDEVIHLNDCIWARDDTVEGPDTCHCVSALTSPKKFFKTSTNESNDRSSLDVLVPLKKVEGNEPFSYEENEKVFYYHRVLDIDNIHKWYEIYVKKVYPLLFRHRVRQLKKECDIDAIKNNTSGEWHLTDCVRSIKWDEGPHTCHCQYAMQEPFLYLKEKYNMVVNQNVEIKPINYIRQPNYSSTSDNSCQKTDT